MDKLDYKDWKTIESAITGLDYMFESEGDYIEYDQEKYSDLRDVPTHELPECILKDFLRMFDKLKECYTAEQWNRVLFTLMKGKMNG
jgi:hypothetical protein